MQVSTVAVDAECFPAVTICSVVTALSKSIEEWLSNHESSITTIIFVVSPQRGMLLVPVQKAVSSVLPSLKRIYTNGTAMNTLALR